jgi:hypothetical protein
MPMAGALTREAILAEHQRTQVERARAGTALGIRPDSSWPAGLGGEVIEQYVDVKQETTAFEAPVRGKRMTLPRGVVTTRVVDARQPCSAQSDCISFAPRVIAFIECMPDVSDLLPSM